MKKKHSLLYTITLAASLLLPFVLAVINLYLGTIPFWYDPARDLLMALDNHQKISLIGQTSGIPGIFYGPYWIWLLSITQFLTYDPRLIAFLVLTLPYFILMPLLLSKFRKQFGLLIPVLMWLLFALSFSAYYTQLWNPHHAPLLCLLTIYLLWSQNYQSKMWKPYFRILAAGISGGLLMNTHISFGLAVIVGSFIFLLFYQNRRKTIPLFTVGLLFIFLPFFLFEARHGFNQIKTVLETVTSATAVVKETSVNKFEIINLFFGSLSRLLQIPLTITYWILGLLFALVLYLFKKKKLQINKDEKKLLVILGTIMAATLSIYLATKNPVWEYHFIGVEILFLLLLGFLAKRNILITYALSCWVVVLIVLTLVRFAGGLSTDPYKVSSLATKEHIIETIYKDAGAQPFSVFTYSPATFTPDYDYLLMWQGQNFRTSQYKKDQKGNVVYLIIPWTTKDLKADFIDNRTPDEEYKTARSWHIADETDVLKRVRYEKK